MAAIEGPAEDVLARVQQIAERHVPGIVCELQNYKTQVGCGILDDRGSLHEVKWALRGLTEYSVESQARAIASRLGPRVTLFQRG